MQKAYVIVETPVDVGNFQADLQKTKTVGYDIETTGLDPYLDRIRLAQFEVNNNIYILNLDDGDLKYFKYFIELVEGSGRTVIAHNAKFEWKWTYHLTGIELNNIYCTQLAEMILTAGMSPRIYFSKLKTLVKDYCGEVLDKDITKLFLTSEVITEEMYLYSALDVKFLKFIMDIQRADADDKGLADTFKLEMKLLPVVAHMEYDGVLLDWDAWTELYKESEATMNRVIVEISDEIFERTWDKVKSKIINGIDAYDMYDIALPTAQNSRTGKVDLTFLEGLTSEVFILKQLKAEFNIASHKQLLKALQLCDICVSDGTLISNTRAETLDSLEGNDTLIDKILEYRKAGKRFTTYGENWKEYIHPVTGRIHPQFNQVGTVTGRWSCERPNLQNIPQDKRYRHCFIARPDHKFLTADYSQAELRLIGAVSGEKNIIDAYKKGEDIHAKTASIIFGKALEDVTKRERDLGKKINFSILYGSTAWGIATKNKDISEDLAEELLAKFFEGYPILEKFIKNTGDTILKEGKSITPMGRVRYFPKKVVFDSDKQQRSYMARVKREGINHIIQGGSGDSLKMAMVKMYYTSPFSHDDFRFQLQVHDEVSLEIAKDIADVGSKFLINAMQEAGQVFLGDVPAEADYVIGDRWEK